MKVNFAHIRERSTTGNYINFAVFEFKPSNGNYQVAIAQLTKKAISAGLKVDKAALAFPEGNRYRFIGPKDLTNYLSKNGVPRWNKTLSI